MQSYEDFFKGKRVTVLGLGLLGRGVGDVEFLAHMGAEVVVTDKKSEIELTESVAKLKQFSNVTLHLGGHRKEDFTTCDMVIYAAGVRLDSPEIAAAREAGIPTYMSTALFAKFARDRGAVIVGITGTRGKSTVTQMVYSIAKMSGKSVHLGGNVRGVSTLALLPHINSGDICVLEIDSWQLQGFGYLEMSPHVSVFTNLMPDHQNYYADMDQYFNDKAYIYSSQNEGDVIFVGESLLERVRATRPVVEPRVPRPLPKDWKISIPGEHNLLNAAFAVEVLRKIGVAEVDIKSGIESFKGVEGRLQFVREVNGVQMYNDNNATTPEATIAALKALSTNKNIILIMGGSDKGLDMGNLLYEIAGTCKRVILLAGTGTDRVVPLMADYSVFDSLEPAVREAVQSAVAGDIILFSPAFASFGMFKNEYERNDQFLAIVKSI